MKNQETSLKLTIELVPSTVWFKSLHKLLPRKVWNSIRAKIIEERGYRCETCGSNKSPFQLHERWEYDDDKHIQHLRGFILLCLKCHWIKHIGLAGIRAKQGKFDFNELIEHFCKVNNCTSRDFYLHEKEAFKMWSERSRHEWRQDFGEYQIYIKEKKGDSRMREGS